MITETGCVYCAVLTEYLNIAFTAGADMYVLSQRVGTIRPASRDHNTQSGWRVCVKVFHYNSQA
jgi:hypothetical protein